MYVIFNGIKYYKNNSTGYYSNSKRKMLHRDTWSFYNGEIPIGFHIHHKDHNKDNNDILNLELKESFKHRSEHGKEHAEVSRENLKVAKEFAREWHSSDKGLEWHKSHYENSLKKSNEQEIEKICSVCNKRYKTNYSSRYKSEFCSNNCRAKNRRISGVDNIKKICPICDNEFNTHKYKGSETCSRICGGKLNALRRSYKHG